MASTTTKKRRPHIRLTTHPAVTGIQPVPVNWGASEASERGPLIGSFSNPEQRNVIGATECF